MGQQATSRSIEHNSYIRCRASAQCNSSAWFGANDLNGLRSSILNIASCVACLGRCRLPHQSVYSKRRKSSLNGKLDRAQQKAKEGVGTILAAYGEIEFALLGILSDTVFDGEAADALRVLFRIPGEGARIDVCDGLVRKRLHEPASRKRTRLSSSR
jgi:hypothetical protein